MQTDHSQRPSRNARGRGADFAFREVRDRILDLRLAPGDPLDEQSLANEFGVSRTPVREALTQLASIGLVEISPNRGARVSPLELTEAPELLEALELFQRATTRWAAARRSQANLVAIERAHEAFSEAVQAGNKEIMGRANYDFHTAISEAAGNRYLTVSAGTVELKTARLVHVAYNSVRSVPDMQSYYDLVVEHHGGMLEAIRERDGEEADRLARLHIDLFRSRLLAFIGHSAATSFVIQMPATEPKTAR